MATRRPYSSLLGALGLVVLVNCGSSSPSTDKKCAATTQALRNMGLRGTTLEKNQLALTFDDGPGPRTKVLSNYLAKEGIRAAFFVNGKMLGPESAETLRVLVADGHLVANHTETHRSLTGASTATARLTNAEVVEELTVTDGKIDPFVPSKRFLFRPPFGDFDDTTFAALSTTPMNKYVGPIMWDVGDKMDAAGGRAADWDCWQEGTDGKRTPMKACADLYLTEIRRENHGIVLLHDPYFNEKDPEQLGTVDMVMYMVPLLKQQGFSFVRVDEIPEVAALLPPLPQAADAAPPLTDAPRPAAPAADDPCR